MKFVDVCHEILSNSKCSEWMKQADEMGKLTERIHQYKDTISYTVLGNPSIKSSKNTCQAWSGTGNG